MHDSGTTREQLLAQIEDLRESELRYRRLSALFSDFLHCCVRRGLDPFCISWLGGAVQQVTGFTEQEIKAQGCWLKFLHPGDMARMGGILLSLSPGDSGEQEFRFIHKDGTVRWFRESYRCEAGNSPHELLLYGSIRDVTERRIKEDRLRMAMRSIETTRECVHWIDDYGRILYANPAMEQTLGYSPGQLQTMTVSDIDPNVPPELWGPTGERVLLMETSGLRKFKTQHLHRDGHLIDMEVDSDGFRLDGRLYFIAIATDITERIKVQELLIRTEKMMSVGGLAAGMAHEINNPLSGILQNVQVLKRRLTEANSRNIQAAEEAGGSFEAVKRFMEKRGVPTCLDAVREAGSRAARIVASMLEFSRADSQDHAPVDLNLLLDKSLVLCATDYDLKKKFDFRNIRLIREYDPELPPVPCSATQIQQVFMNLLTNAAQATVQTLGPAITLRTSHEGGFARIEITDNGPGMTEEVRRRAFEPFFTTKPVGEGTGLGLSVSYFIVCNNHQGAIEALPALGGGTRFVVTLPFGTLGTFAAPAQS